MEATPLLDHFFIAKGLALKEGTTVVPIDIGASVGSIVCYASWIYINQYIPPVIK